MTFPFSKRSDSYWHFSFFDFFQLLKKEKGRLLFIFFSLFSLFFIKQLLKPISFTAKGIYKDTQADSASISKTLDFVLGVESSLSKHDNPIELLTTYGVLEKVVKQTFLQGHIVEKNGGKTLRLITENLALQRRFCHLKTRERPSFLPKDQDFLVPEKPILAGTLPQITFSELFYDQEVFTVISIYFSDDRSFLVKDIRDKILGNGELEIPFDFNKAQFTLTKKGNGDLKGKTFILTFIPLETATKVLNKNLLIKRDKLKLSLLNIFYKANDKYLARDVVNALMESYQLFTSEKTQEKNERQLKYLHQRKEETIKELEQVMQEHKKTLKEHVDNGGFLDFSKEAEFMMKSRLALLADQEEIKFKMGQLGGILFDESVFNFEENLQRISDAKDLWQEENQRGPLLSISHSEQLLDEYLAKIDANELTIKHAHYCLDKLESEDVDVTSLISAINEPLLSDFIKEIQVSFTQMHDVLNRTEREKSYLKEQLNNKRELLKNELTELIEGYKLQKDVLLKNLEELQKGYLLCLVEAYEKNKQLLIDFTKREADFPEKWFKEKKLELNSQMAVSFVEQIAKAIEGKNLNSHLMAVDSYPIELALLPLLPNPPELFFKPTIAALGALLFYLGICVVLYLYKGAFASFKNLKSAGYFVFGEVMSPVPKMFKDLSLKDKECLKKLAFHLREQKIVLFTSQISLHFIYVFLQLFEKKGSKVLLIDLNDEHSSGLKSYLEKTKIDLPIQEKKGYDFLSFGGKTEFKEELLSLDTFKSLLQTLKETYDQIFIINQASLNLETHILQLIADSVVYLVTAERLCDLDALPLTTCYLTIRKETSKNIKERYLKELSPLIDSLKSNVSSKFRDHFSFRGKKE